MLKQWFFVAALMLWLVPQADAQELSDPAIEGVIQSQIEAFGADDFEGAFAYASPGIRQFFGSTARFRAMVQQGYPMVIAPDRVEFLDQAPFEGAVMQSVLITDRNGVQHGLLYQMIPTPDGWQINGVEIIRPPEIGV